MEEKTLTPIKAIRANCLDCCCGSASEVKACPITKCPLYPFRLGHNPNRKVELTEEQREARAQILKNARKNAISTKQN